uniref:Reverse transcriptase domain-containing protein n=1 Tax=Acrobeloides nanus TaxID=290746 RepID=A0A914D1Z8_9BILA
MYADDLAYVKPLVDDQAEAQLHEDMWLLTKKYEEICLSLNSKKSKFMLLNPSHKTFDLAVSIYGEEIERVDQFRYFGIDLDPKLCYRNHVARITMKCKQALGALCRTVRKWAPKHVFTKLYQSTIEPILTYAMEAWYPSQAVLQNSIERVKKFAARLATNDLRYSIRYISLLDNLNWISLSQLAMEKRAVLAHHYANGRRQIPDNAFVLKSSLDLRQSARASHGLELVLPATSLEAVCSSSVNSVRRIWNELPAEVATTHDLRQFKRLIRSLCCPFDKECDQKSGIHSVLLVRNRTALLYFIY